MNRAVEEYARWSFARSDLPANEGRKLDRRFGFAKWDKARNRLDDWQKTAGLTRKETRKRAGPRRKIDAAEVVARRRKMHPIGGPKEVRRQIEALQRVRQLQKQLSEPSLKRRFILAARKAFSTSEEGLRRLQAFKDQRSLLKRRLSAQRRKAASERIDSRLRSLPRPLGKPTVADQVAALRDGQPTITPVAPRKNRR